MNALKPAHKLTLRREILRSLTPAQLGSAQGGISASLTCYCTGMCRDDSTLKDLEAQDKIGNFAIQDLL